MRIIIDIEERDERFDPDEMLRAMTHNTNELLFGMVQAKNWKVYEEEKDSE